MPKFNAKLLGRSESIENKENKNWWQKNPMIYDWDNKLGEPVFDEKYLQK